MRRPLLVGIAVAAIAGSAAAWVLFHRPSHPPQTKTSAHGAGIDRELSPLTAMYKAPPGNTPCETAYNAFQAGEAAGHAPGATPLVLRLAPRDEFLARCNRLPALAQQCLTAAYSTHHREECTRARPSSETLGPMFELKTAPDTRADERDAQRQFQSTRK